MSRVLVIDDEPRIVSFVSRALVAQGFSVESACDGLQALEMAKSRQYELVILDLRMPGLDGLTVLRSLIELHPEQRVLVLSVADDVDSKVLCLELGASDFLPKPFAVTELVARVRARLREPETQRSPPERFLKAGPLNLDNDRRVADMGRGPVGLTDREFLMLQHLMRRQGETCTRQDLLAAVWGYSFDPGSNVVDVYIGRLRSKLGAIIETVRNVGYRLDVA